MMCKTKFITIIIIADNKYVVMTSLLLLNNNNFFSLLYCDTISQDPRHYRRLGRATSSSDKSLVVACSEGLLDTLVGDHFATALTTSILLSKFSYYKR